MMKSEVSSIGIREGLKGFIGLSAKSGSLRCGSEVCLNNIRKHDLYLIIISSEASNRTKKLFYDKCSFYDVSIVELDSDLILEATGRTGNKVFGITNKGLAAEIARLDREFRGCNLE